MLNPILTSLRISLVLLLLYPASLLAEVPQKEVNDKVLPADSPLMKAYYESGEITLPEEFSAAVKMTLADAIEKALSENLELKAATFSARSSAAVLRGEYGLYDPTLVAEYFSGESDEPLNSSPLTELTDEFNYYSVSLLQKLPIGTELALSGVVNEDEFQPALPISPATDSQARISLTQPLLRDFGVTVTNQKIIFAAKDKEIALQDLRSRAFSVVSAVRNAFFDTLRAQYELSYRETSVALAQRIVRENEARVDAGILPPVEKLEAEVGLQTRERFLLDAQRSFGDSLDRFNLLLNASGVEYIPVIEPIRMDFNPSEQDGTDAGLKLRPDVLKRLEEIEKVQTEHEIARNALLPELDLIASYSVNGLADSASDSLDMAVDGDYDAWEVGLKLSYPLGSIESRNRLKQSAVDLMQERALLSQLHNEVSSEVRAAIRNINVSRKKTEVASRGQELAREKLRILLKSREVGLATTRDVLDGEEDLASARTEQISSVADYFKAVTDYLSVTGTLLLSEGIVFEGDVTPDLQRIPFYLR